MSFLRASNFVGEMAANWRGAQATVRKSRPVEAHLEGGGGEGREAGEGGREGGRGGKEGREGREGGREGGGRVQGS